VIAEVAGMSPCVAGELARRIAANPAETTATQDGHTRPPWLLHFSVARYLRAGARSFIAAWPAVGCIVSGASISASRIRIAYFLFPIAY
jgi:hypothetical protein